MNRKAALAIPLALLVVIPVIAYGAFMMMATSVFTAGGQSTTSCEAPTGSSIVVAVAEARPTPTSLPVNDVDGYGPEQLQNAQSIMNAAVTLGLSYNAQVIGVMTAMGESSLISIDYGDWETSGVRNPDGSPTTSIGLFQQQEWWGSVADRMDPTISATLFFSALTGVDGWETLRPTIAAHRVQGNADPEHYQQYYQPAINVVSALSGAPLSPDQGGICQVGPGGNHGEQNGEPGPWGGYENGKIPNEQLTAITWESGVILRSDAAQALTELNAAYQADFHTNLPLNDGYRSFEDQVIAKQVYGDEAAEPGQSNHGWALAIDVGTPSHGRLVYGSETYRWLVANGPRFGWMNPDWALPGGTGPEEAWHWEYWGKAAK